MAVATYDPLQVIMTYAGAIISGYAENTMIEASRNEDTFKLKKGAQGDGIRSKNANHSGKVKITLLQSSASNALLSAQANLDELGTGNAGVAPLLIKDLNGGTIIAAAEAWVSKPADYGYEKEQKDRVWTIEANDLVMALA